MEAHESDRAMPSGLTPQQAWRWCLRQTLREGRLAAAEGRAISLPNLERLFCRQWHRVAATLKPALDQKRAQQWEQTGRRWVRQQARKIGRSARS